MHFDIDKHTIYLARHGSYAYRTSLPTSDFDMKGFAVSPKHFVLGFAYNFAQHESVFKYERADEVPDAMREVLPAATWERVLAARTAIEQEHVPKTPDETIYESAVYDIRKFCNLAADCNPNIIEVLFVADEDVIRMHPAGRLIRENRDLFLSKKARHKFSGYAIGQLKRIRTHRGYLLNPPDHKPTREEYGLSIEMKITADMMGAFDKTAGAGMPVDPNVMQLVAAEKRYKAALDAWNSHENWKTTRNEKRSVLEAQYGYDTKHGMHLVRLLRMCREILEGQGVIVQRPDAKELLAIRAGEWPYDKLVEWAEQQDAEMQKLYETSSLPHAPDMEKLNALCVEAEELFWSTP